MAAQTRTANRHHRIIIWSLLLLLGATLLLPLIPYAMDYVDPSGPVPNPGAELWRDVLSGNAGTTQVQGVDSGVLINESGERWRHFRMNQLIPVGAVFMGSVLALIGAVMLAGIVVNNAIVLVDAVNRRRREGEPVEAAIVGAGRERLRPILMTTATTVLALLPMALGLGAGDELRRPLAVTVIGGLTVATLLTLIVIPCLYRSFTRRETGEAVS